MLSGFFDETIKNNTSMDNTEFIYTKGNQLSRNISILRDIARVLAVVEKL